PRTAVTRAFPDDRPLGSRQRLQELNLPTRGYGCNDFPLKTAAATHPIPPCAYRTRRFAFTPPPQSSHPAPRERPATSFGLGRGAAANPHQEAQVQHKRALRSRIRATISRATATSASGTRRDCEGLTTLAPSLISCSSSVVSVQPRIGWGRTSCPRKLARWYAKANRCNRAVLSWKRRHDSFVHCSACVPSFLACPAVPLGLEKRTTFFARHFRLVTRTPMRGNNSPACHATLTSTRRACSHDPAR